MLVSKSSTENIERESLPTHVELCAHRVAIINKRIVDIENSHIKLNEELDSLRLFIIKSISTATAVLTTVVSLTIIILDRMN